MITISSHPSYERAARRAAAAGCRCTAPRSILRWVLTHEEAWRPEPGAKVRLRSISPAEREDRRALECVDEYPDTRAARRCVVKRIRRLSRVEIQRAAAGVPDASAPEHVLDTRLVRARAAVIAALRKQRLASRRRSCPAPWMRARTYRHGVLWVRRESDGPRYTVTQREEPLPSTVGESRAAALRRYAWDRHRYLHRHIGTRTVWQRTVDRTWHGYCSAHESWRLTMLGPPTRRKVAAALRAQRRMDGAAPDPRGLTVLGWRAWLVEDGVLVSPFQCTPWTSVRLVARDYSDNAAVSGHAGIHALRMPRWDWRTLLGTIGHTLKLAYALATGVVVTGVVERFGRAVLGETGWRAEEVVIRELLAPTEELYLTLTARYPEAIVHYRR